MRVVSFYLGVVGQFLGSPVVIRDRLEYTCYIGERFTTGFTLHNLPVHCGETTSLVIT